MNEAAAQAGQQAVEVLPAWKQILVIYGPLGILALLACLVAINLYRDLKEERAARLADATKHNAEMRAMEERYIAKTETQIEKYHELSKTLNQTLDSAFRRYPRNSGGSYGGQGSGPG